MDGCSSPSARRESRTRTVIQRTPQEVGANPLLARIDPALGAKLLALSCDLVWATTWESEADECLAPLLELPQLPEVTWPKPSEEPELSSLQWKSRTLPGWATRRPFAWLDDEITDVDRTWADLHHPARTFLHRVYHRHGLLVGGLRHS